MLHFKPSALIRWRADNSQVALNQFKKGESTGFHQTQGLSILANVWKPKMTVGSLVILEVFFSRVAWSQVDVQQLVVCSLTRIFDTHSKVGDVVVILIFTIFNGVGSFYWTSHRNPFRKRVCRSAAHVWLFLGQALPLKIRPISLYFIKVFFNALNYLTFMVFKLDSWKYTSLIWQNIPVRNMNVHIESLHLSDYHFTFDLVICKLINYIMTSLKHIIYISTLWLAILCSLFKFSKHYSAIFSITNCIIIIIRESDFWERRKPIIWKCCEFRCY